MQKISIPEISDDHLEALMAEIHPVVKEGNKLFYVDVEEPRKTSFLWDQILTTEAENLVPVHQIKTYHTYGYYGFFKPSVAEILAQIPEKLIGEVVAFSVEGPNDVSDLSLNKDALDQGFHVALTTLYSKGSKSKKKEEIKAKLIPKEYTIEHDGDPELYFYLRRSIEICGEVWNIYLGAAIKTPWTKYGENFKTVDEAFQAFKIGFSNSLAYKKHKNE